MSEAPPPTIERCPNCGHESGGEFCPACGQKRIHAGDLGLRHAWHHVLHEVGHVDGKFLSSVKLLFARPGQLTLDFIAGRRAQHVHPIRLFLVFGVAFFFLAHVDSPLDLRAGMEINPAAKQVWGNLAGRIGLTLDQFLDLHKARMDAVFKPVDTFAILLHGFWLWVMFRKRRRYLAENMVTALHLACFTMAMWLVASCLHLWGVSHIITALLLLVGSIVYFGLTTRRVYGIGWLAALGAWLVLQLSTFVVIALAMIAVMINVVREAASLPANIVVLAVPSAAPAAPDQPVELFDGRSLAGWTLVSRAADAGAKSIWSVKDGALHAAGSLGGYARTTAVYRDYALHVEWRWPEAEGTCGILLHVSGPEKLVPICLRVRLKPGESGAVRAPSEIRILGQNHAANEAVNLPARQPKVEKPAGEWNSCDIVCRGGALTVSINGVLENEVAGASIAAGAIALQSDLAPVEYRNVRLTPLR